eukprot:331920-Prorocentrum_minimum.AAC.3
MRVAHRSKAPSSTLPPTTRAREYDHPLALRTRWLALSTHGQAANCHTLPTISMPVGTCHAKRPRLTQLRAMCALRATVLPFCMYGTSAAAIAHSTVMPTPDDCATRRGFIDQV